VEDYAHSDNGCEELIFTIYCSGAVNSY